MVGADNDGLSYTGHYGDFGIESSGFSQVTSGIIKNISLNTAGSGYSAGDVLTVDDGGNSATVEILTVDGSGVPQTFQLQNNGTGYSIENGIPTSYTGAGAGFKINVNHG